MQRWIDESGAIGPGVTGLDPNAPLRVRRRASFLGFPIEISSKLPAVATSLAGAPMLFFGDLGRSTVIGERRGLRLRVSEQRYADADQIGILVTARGAIANFDVGTSDAVGPIAALIGTS